MTDAIVIDISLSASLPRARRATAPGASLTWLEEQVERGGEARVGGYALQKLLGEGEVGVVFAADDLERGGQVALRLLRTPDRNAGPGERALLRAVQEVARLGHPNIVHVVEVGEADGHLFVAMELLAGPTLPEWLRAAPRRWPELLPIVAQIGGALQAAHEIGVVHGEFTAASVRFGQDGRPRVLDFGSARARAGEVDARPGPLVYTAPELLRRRPPDARSDQYALCVALYEALYGAPPFVAEERELLLAAIAAGKPAPPPAGARVPEWLQAAVARGMATDPKQRFPSIAALLAELARGSAAQRTRRWFHAAGLAAIAGLAAFHTVDQRAIEVERSRRCEASGAPISAWDEDRREAVRTAIFGSGVPYAEDTWPRVAARLDDYAAQWSALRLESCSIPYGQMSDRDLELRAACLEQRRRDLAALTATLARADHAAVARAAEATYELRPPAECADVLGLRSEVAPPDATLADEVDRLRELLSAPRAELLAGRPARARELLVDLLPAALGTGYRPLRAEAMLLSGLVEEALGDPKLAAARLEEALLDAESSHHDALAAEAAVRLVLVVGHHLGQPEVAAQWERHAQAAFERRGGPRELEVAWETALGEVAARSGDLPGARDRFESALAAAERLLGPGHHAIAILHARLGALARETDDHQRAREHLDEALTRLEALLGPDHPTIAAVLREAGAAALARGDHVEAQAHFERALVIYERAVGEAHPEAARISGELAALHMRQGRYAAARNHFEKALALRRSLGGEDDPELPTLEADLAESSLRVHDLDAARQHLDLALAGLRATHGEHHPRYLAALAIGGRLELELGKTRAGIAILEQTLKKMAATDDMPRGDLGRTRFALARTLAGNKVRRVRTRALALARAAAGDLEAAGLTRELGEVRIWLKGQGPIKGRGGR